MKLKALLNQYLLILILCFSSWNLFAQGHKSGQRLFLGPGVDQFYNAKRLSSGKIVLLGRTDSHRNGGYQNKDGWVVMLSANGDTLWSRAYGGESRTDRFWDMEEMDNGDLLFVGASGSFLGSENVYVVQTDSSGKLLRSFNYGDKGYDTARDLELLPDGGWLMVGETRADQEDPNSPSHILLIRCAANGQPTWMQSIESQESSYGYKALVANDDSFYVLGHVKIKERFHITLHCYNSRGDLKFAKTYKGSSPKGEASMDMIRTLSGNIIISGLSVDSTYNGLLMEVDSRGRVKRSFEYRSAKDLELLRLAQDADSSLWIAGFCTEDSKTSSGSLLKLGADFQVLKARQFRPFSDDIYFSTVSLLPEEQLLLVGSHTDQSGHKKEGYVGLLKKGGGFLPYEHALSITRRVYPMEYVNVKFQQRKAGGFSTVQSLVLPVNVEKINISD